MKPERMDGLTQISTQEVTVWDGRFQPLHVAHIAVIRAILKQFQRPLVLMIIQSTSGCDGTPFSVRAAPHHEPARNPLTFWERFTLVTLALKAERLSEVHVLGIPRPDLHWPLCRSFYPPNRVICLTGKDDYEEAKRDFWTGLNERVCHLSASHLPKISATEVKRAIKTNGPWQSLLHPATVDYFESIDGPRRFAEADV